MYSNSNEAYTPDVEIVATNTGTGGNKVTKLPFGDDEAKAEEYNSPKCWRDQHPQQEVPHWWSRRRRCPSCSGAWSVPSVKESHVNKNSAAVVRKPASAKSSKAPFAKAAKSSGGGGDGEPLGSSACASKCTECVSVDGAVPDGSFRGFSFGEHGSGIFCWCHVDYGATYSPGAGCTDYDYADCGGTYAGTGDILGVSDFGLGENHVCYKYLPAQDPQP
eukprot:scaffold39928_cov178-Skeletonema_dohrnii-CCMP3373.AAC.1